MLLPTILLLLVTGLALAALVLWRRRARRQRQDSLVRFVTSVQGPGVSRVARAAPPRPSLTPAPGRAPVELEAADTLPTFADVGGMAHVVRGLAATVGPRLRRPSPGGTDRPRVNGVLLHGPSGAGKTHIARCLAGEYGCALLHLSTGDLVGGGDPAATVRRAFELVVDHRPAVLLFDEFDAVAHHRPGHPGEERLVAELLRALEESQEIDGVLVVAASSDRDALDPAVVRQGCFDHHVRVDLPDADARRAVLEAELGRRPATVTIPPDEIVEATAGQSAAALVALVERAALAAFRDAAGSGEPVAISAAHLAAALAGPHDPDRSTVGVWTWERLVLPEAVTHELRQAEAMLAEPALARSLGVEPPRGILLVGPTGSGKTSVARVLAAGDRCAVHPVSATVVSRTWAGEPEQAVQRLFARARANRPAIVFIDDVDALGAGPDGSGDAVGDRQRAQLLVEMDGLAPAAGVLVIGTASRLEAVDPDLRGGDRLSRVLELPLPDQAARWRILEQCTRRMPTAGVDLSAVAAATGGRSGADLVALCHQARQEAHARARQEGDATAHVVTAADFARAVATRHPVR